MPVKIFFPFEMDQFYPETAQNAMKILKRIDYAAQYDPTQTDCGKMAFENGNWEIAKNVAEKFVKTFSDSAPLIIPSASNVYYIKNHFRKMFHNSGLHVAYQQVANQCVEFFDFLYNDVGIRDIGAVFDREAVFHNCISGVSNDVFQKFLSHVKGLKLIKHDDIASKCCGSNFIFGLNNAPIAAAMASRILQEAMRADIRTIIVGDIECKFHLDGYLRKQKSYLTVVHIIDVLASGW